ncbi:MAG: hypothetical protein N7Q72_07550, partial [Spiroplasma sp. Tabriz.8]|nr:hypothetical protein [Spiroplasma sp. Tabriz.8]
YCNIYLFINLLVYSFIWKTELLTFYDIYIYIYIYIYLCNYYYGRPSLYIYIYIYIYLFIYYYGKLSLQI